MNRYHRVLLTTRQAWLALALTIACEVVATTATKASDGMTRLGPALVAVVGFALTTLFLAKVVEVIPTGVAYTVWTGSGSALVATIGVVFFHDRLDLAVVVGIALVVLGVVLLNPPPGPRPS